METAVAIITLNCPDCGTAMKPKGNDTYWCTPCKRGRVPQHMEKYVEPVKTIRAKFTRLPDQHLTSASASQETKEHG